jgi:alpha-beta hydrolase superfamily lysophospholipase
VNSYAADGRADPAGLSPPDLPSGVRRTESRFLGHSRLALFCRSWLPREPVRSIALVHGFGEHSGRYEHLGSWFAERNTAVHSFDLRGHGRSPGPRGHVDGFGDYLNDLEKFLETVHEASGSLPVTLMGHSLGGLIVTAYTVERSPRVESVVTSGAALELSSELSRFKITLARLLRGVAPRFGMDAGLDPNAICTDPDVVKRYVDDPLVHGVTTTSHAVAMIDQIERLRGAGVRVKLPMLLAHGEADRLCPASGSRSFYECLPGADEGAAAPRAELRTYPDCGHEIFNDFGYEGVFADVLGFIERCEKDGGADRLAEEAPHVG